MTLAQVNIEALWDEVDSTLPCFPDGLLHLSIYWDYVHDADLHSKLLTDKDPDYWEIKRTFFLLVLAAEGEL